MIVSAQTDLLHETGLVLLEHEPCRQRGLLAQLVDHTKMIAEGLMDENTADHKHHLPPELPKDEQYPSMDSSQQVVEHKKMSAEELEAVRMVDYKPPQLSECDKAR